MSSGIFSLHAEGGGGYGPPHERPAEKVREDVEEKWITKERAWKVYGVAIDEAGEVDEARTARRRKRLSGGRSIPSEE